MKIHIVSVCCLLSLLATPASSSADCLPKVSEIPGLSGFTVHLTEKPDLCNPSDPNYKMIKALMYIRDLKFEGKAPGPKFNQNLLGYNWLDRLRELSPNILNYKRYPKAKGEKVCDGDPRTGELAFTERVRSPKKMFICPSRFANAGIYELVETMMHETWHMNPGTPIHVACGNKGGLACDKSILSHGGYAADIEVRAKLSTMVKDISPQDRIQIIQGIALDVQTRFRDRAAERDKLADSGGPSAVFDSQKAEEQELRSLAESNLGLPKLPDRATRAIPPGNPLDKGTSMQ